MCPAVYNYIVYRSKDRATQELPLKEDIPLSMATAGLFTLIEQVSTYCVQKAFLHTCIHLITFVLQTNTITLMSYCMGERAAAVCDHRPLFNH